MKDENLEISKFANCLAHEWPRLANWVVRKLKTYLSKLIQLFRTTPPFIVSNEFSEINMYNNKIYLSIKLKMHFFMQIHLRNADVLLRSCNLNRDLNPGSSID